MTDNDMRKGFTRWLLYRTAIAAAVIGAVWMVLP